MKAYLAFLAEPPLIGLDPHPAYAPSPEIAHHNAAGYLETLGGNTDRDALVRETEEDHESRLADVEAGNLEDADDADIVLEIEIGDDGQIAVFDGTPRILIARFHIEDVYRAYGMTMPAS